eukprot:872895-Rhodomonas_salina.6
MEIQIEPHLFKAWLNTALDREPLEKLMGGGDSHTTLSLNRADPEPDRSEVQCGTGIAYVEGRRRKVRGTETASAEGRSTQHTTAMECLVSSRTGTLTRPGAHAYRLHCCALLEDRAEL